MKKYNPKKFFNSEEKKTIENKITEIEKKTSGEIVVMVAKNSGKYFEIENFISILFSFLFSILLLYFSPEIIQNIFKIKDSSIINFIKIPFDVKEELRFFVTFGIWFFIPMQIIFYFLSRFLIRFLPGIKRLFISEKHKSFKVKEKAIKAFHENGLHKTRDETGVLFLFSLLERKVYILADKGIYDKISQTTLDNYAKDISSGLKAGKGTEAFINAITHLGEILAKNFPIKPDDTNELSNEIIIE